MEIVIICLAAFATSLLTFFSGFGLGTILMPVFAIFFPVDLAIALTGIVHFLNNLFKLALVGLKADRQVVIRFGVPAFLSALIGAYLLLMISELPSIHSYTIGNKSFDITPVKLTVALLLILFTLFEVVPVFSNLQFGKGSPGWSADRLIIGGLLSGFFGGLSGHQGALRSAFLIKTNLSKEAFVASGIVIACIVDFSRLGVYSTRFSNFALGENIVLIASASSAAFMGAYLGSVVLKKVTMKIVQGIVTIMLLILSLALGLGMV